MSLRVRCPTKRCLLVFCCFSALLVLTTAKQSLGPTGQASVTTSANSVGQAAECYIEIQQTKLVPGRCLPVGRLSTMPNLCQSLDREVISIQNECAEVRAAKRERFTT